MGKKPWIGRLSTACVTAVAIVAGAVTFGSELDVANFANGTSPTGGIQEAINALPPAGGVVTIPKGEYALRQQIVLRSGVTLRGAGPGTILHKPRYAETKLAATAQQGSRSVQVTSGQGFAASDQVAIRDADAMGWNVVQAIVTGVQGNELQLDRPMPRTCSAAKHGLVVICFPAITCRTASNIVLKDFVIREDNRRDLSVHEPLDTNNKRLMWAFNLSFPLAAINLVDANDSRIEGVSVVGWFSDGISLQLGGNDTVVNCLAEKCGCGSPFSGKGIHAGGGLHDSLFSHNVSRNNNDDGFYFCSNTRKLLVSENTFINNKCNGIGGLGDNGDKFNTVAKNTISGNGMHGIQMCDGDSNSAVDNTISNNSQSAPEQYSGIWLRKTSQSVVKGNRCFDDQKAKTQQHGVEELAGCRENTISGNDCHGNAQADQMLAADQPPAPPDTAPRRGRGAAGASSAAPPQPAEADSSGPTRPRGAARAPAADPPQPAADQAQPTVPMKVGPSKIIDYHDPAYGTQIRQLRKDDGHEHTLYHYRDEWNADATRMLGVQTDFDQQNWHLCLYDGDGVFLKDLYPISKYDWRVCWDRNNADLFYTWTGSRLVRLNVKTNQADVLKDFAPLSLASNGPSVNRAGDRILVLTGDPGNKKDMLFRSYHLPEMSDERTFQVAIPEGCFPGWSKARYIGYGNCVALAYSGVAAGKQGILVYDDTGALVHAFADIGGGGHYDFSPDGKLAYFKYPVGARGGPITPFEIHVVNLDGTHDRILFSLPASRLHGNNLHLSWPTKVNDWFVAGFFPNGPPPAAPQGTGPAGSSEAQANDSPRRNSTARPQTTVPAPHRPAEPPWDEILMVRLDGTKKYLCRTETVYSRAAGRGAAGDMFWAQPLPRPSPDGKRICFNSNRSGTIDLHILYVEGGPSAPAGR